MSNIKNKHFTNITDLDIMYLRKGGIKMKNDYLNNDDKVRLYEIKKQKVILYLTKVVYELNSKYNNLIQDEKFKRAIEMFTNINEDYETIKAMIDWHVENEKRQYMERQYKHKSYQIKSQQKRKAKSLSYKKVA